MTRRNILFVTTDQQRFDALGCNGGQIARTPVIDGLAANGLNYQRAYNQNTVCMPARSTMLTGQYVRTHGVVANGIPLPDDAPSVADWLRTQAGYRTALLGKAHFEPGNDPKYRWAENRRPRDGETGEWRGFETAIQVMHTALHPAGKPMAHYGYWMAERHPEHMDSFAPLLSAEGGGDTGAPETKLNPIPREWYHTDWVADHAVAWLDTLNVDEPFFCWMSFPDPHHPWDPPASEQHRVDWRDLDLPPGHPGSRSAIEAILGRKPAHWLGYYDGSYMNFEGGPATFRPHAMTHDQVREVNAKTHIMNELIDEALGRVLLHLAALGRLDDTDVIFTTDHGELQGDYGLLFKGPYHCEALMRLPFIWRPAPSAGVAGGQRIDDPVGQVDLAPTFCAIAGIDPAPWMQGHALPTTGGSAERDHIVCEWDSQFPQYGMHLRSIYADGWLCTVHDRSTGGQPNGLEDDRLVQRLLGPLTAMGVQYDGTEGELYNLVDDPLQHHNLWSDPAYAAQRADLEDRLRESLADMPVRPLLVEAVA